MALRDRWPRTWPLQPVPRLPGARQAPTYRDAKPSLIEAALKRAEARPSGNWFVFAAGRDVRGDRPYGFSVAGIELVAWRNQAGKLLVGPGACPHLGAPMALGRVDDGGLRCRWHGLRLDESSWPAFDDGVLAWVRLDRVGGETPSPAPVVPARPSAGVDSVARMDGVCEPRDIIANRLDPWHGSWFHPYSFTRLQVRSAPAEVDVAEEDDRFLVSVTFRVTPSLGVPVQAEFSCPEPRTVVMRITDGEGVGSVVETHATPLGTSRDGRPRTAVIEAVVAASDRPGFAVARAAAPALRPLMRHAAARLWKDDLAYAERRYRLRSQEWTSRGGRSDSGHT